MLRARTGAGKARADGSATASADPLRQVEAARARLGLTVTAGTGRDQAAPVAAIVGYPLEPGIGADHGRQAARRDAARGSLPDPRFPRAGLVGPIWDLMPGCRRHVFPEGAVAANFLCALGYGDDRCLRRSGASERRGMQHPVTIRAA
jgi:hypothetical protein